jgi:hypothetical protein
LLPGETEKDKLTARSIRHSLTWACNDARCPDQHCLSKCGEMDVRELREGFNKAMLDSKTCREDLLERELVRAKTEHDLDMYAYLLALDFCMVWVA